MNHGSWLSIVGMFIFLVIIITKVLFHFLLCTLMYKDPSLQTLSGFRYFVTFVDDCSYVTRVYLLKNKSDVYVAFKSFHNMVTS